MPANLPPEYLKAQKRYRLAKTPPDKIKALQEMLAVMPKHKGTDKLQADLRRRISNVRKQMLEKKRKVGRASHMDHVEREGAGQVALVGMPNCGKSSILTAVTRATPKVADYPFSTFRPLPGMMPFEDIQIQLVDLPPVSEYTESWVFNIIRNADLVLLIVDLSDSQAEESVLTVMETLEKANILLTGEEKKEDANRPVVSKRTIIIGAKHDANGVTPQAQSLQKTCGEEFPIIFVSAKNGKNMEEMKKEVFKALNILRIYTKEPGKKPDMEKPYILPKGSTVLDVAEMIHRDFLDKLKFARIWGSEKYDGQQVQWDYLVEDGDVIEIHI